MNPLPPVTPGELLEQEFLQPLGISQYRLANEIGVPASRISEIIAIAAAEMAEELERIQPLAPC
jgi:antitoxin HigA-1